MTARTHIGKRQPGYGQQCFAVEIDHFQLIFQGNLFKAAEFAKNHRLDSLEIRSVNNHSPYELTDEDVLQIKKAAEDNGLEIVAISSPLFKCDFDNEIARTEQYHEGTIPLQTLRADIDYGFAEAATTYGILGVKVWIYKGEVLADNRRTKKEGGAR